MATRVDYNAFILVTNNEIRFPNPYTWKLIVLRLSSLINNPWVKEVTKIEIAKCLRLYEEGSAFQKLREKKTCSPNYIY